MTYHGDFYPKRHYQSQWPATIDVAWMGMDRGGVVLKSILRMIVCTHNLSASVS
jgi:hypothetical protein